MIPGTFPFLTVSPMTEAHDQLGCVTEAAALAGIPFDRTIPAVMLAPAPVVPTG